MEGLRQHRYATHVGGYGRQGGFWKPILNYGSMRLGPRLALGHLKAFQFCVFCLGGK